jgi:hypothetical protein
MMNRKRPKRLVDAGWPVMYHVEKNGAGGSLNFTDGTFGIGDAILPMAADSAHG